MTGVPGEIWRVRVTAPWAATAACEAALGTVCESVALFGEPGSEWTIEGFSRRPPDRPALEMALALAFAGSGLPPSAASIEPLAPRDWLADNVAAFPPFRLGRWWIRGSGAAGAVPGGVIELRLDAGAAFGSGRHASTAGCLQVLDRLPPPAPRRVLDLGSGSGILAIAAARRWRCGVVAADIDPLAVAVTAANARANGVAPLVTAVAADGFAHPRIVAAAPYDLIVANILARPLRRLARQVAANLAPSGTVVLAGFVAADGRSVAAPYRALGLCARRSLDLEGWRTLIMERCGPPSPMPLVP
jgi:ribosomal protein L11 methyltransferase